MFEDLNIDDITPTDVDRIEKGLRACGWPPALVKAVFDPFDYRCHLRTGETIDFSSADVLSKHWVRLREVEVHGKQRLVYSRGLEVRVAEIAWVADGPREH